MAENYLITGYHGEPHVTVENARGFNAAIFGEGKFVLPVGEMFRCERVGSNTIRLYDGKLIDNGAVAGIPAGEYIDFVIPEAGHGMYRIDLVIFEYSRDSSTLIESGVFKVISGTEKATEAETLPPELTENNILDNISSFDQMELWAVCVSDIGVVNILMGFKTSKNLLSLDNVEYIGSSEKGAKNGVATLDAKGFLVQKNATTEETTDVFTYTYGGFYGVGTAKWHKTGGLISAKITTREYDISEDVIRLYVKQPTFGFGLFNVACTNAGTIAKKSGETIRDIVVTEVGIEQVNDNMFYCIRAMGAGTASVNGKTITATFSLVNHTN